MMRARDVGGAVGILRAGIDQEHFVRMDGAVCGARHPVMHDGAVAARARNGVEATGRSTHRWRGGNLPAVSAASISVSSPPGASRVNQARNRASAAPSRMWALRVPSISIVLAGLRQLTGIGGAV